MKIRTDGSFPLYENLKKMDYKKENSFPPFSTLDRQITALEKKTFCTTYSTATNRKNG